MRKLFIGLAAQQADSVWFLDRRYTRTHRDEDRRLAKLYVENKEILLKFFPEYLEFCDIGEDESKGVYRDFAMKPEEDPDR